MKLILYFLISFTIFSNLYAENYAVLISAGQSTQDDEYTNCEYWYDLYLAYEDLIIREGYSHENVIVFYGDGNDWEGTNRDRYKKELHRWQEPIVDFDNAKGTIEDVFSDLSSIITVDDNILIRWVVGHGGASDPDDYVALIENTSEYISESEILSIINQINNFNRRKLIWMTCNSGSLVAGQQRFECDNTTIITGCDWDEVCSSFTLQGETKHAEFNYVVTSSLFREDPLGTDYEADNNDDNVINYDEVYEDALNSPIMSSTPQIGDDCPMADYLFVDEELLLEDVQLTGAIEYRTDRLTTENDVEILNGADITIACDDEIIFNPGFRTNVGSNLDAYIGFINCPPGGIIQTSTLITEPQIINTINLEVFPVPASNLLSIKYLITNQSDIELYIFDIYGLKVIDIENNVVDKGSHSKKIRLDGLSSGMYFLTLKSGGQAVTRQFAVAR